MSKEKRKTVFNIAVIGLSGTEQIKGTSGVGKSCLCNRFVREDADDYYPDHTSVLSQSDFGGRIINNDHFLYWGEVAKKDDNGQDYKFNVIEQTEFIDDQSYQAHRSSSNQNYLKRSAQTKVTSAEKLMYICTDQLGVEADFEQKSMPDGKLTIDGFVLCFDVSFVTNRSITDQVHFVQQCYHSLAKTKKPVVLALTKCDEAVATHIKDAEIFAANVAGKKSSVTLPVIETSASENINVTLTFLILAQLIDKTRSKSKVISFREAAQARKEVLKEAKERLEKLLEEIVTDYHETWQGCKKHLEDKSQCLDYIKLEGKNSVSNIFRKHIKMLRDVYRLNLQNEYMRFFSKALKKILPDLAKVRSSWLETLDVIESVPEFSNWIIKLENLNNAANGETCTNVTNAKPLEDRRNGAYWYEHPHVKSLEDRRIPFDLLLTSDAERYFLCHKEDLAAQQRRAEMKKNFRELLSQSTEVTPGREWADVTKYFKQDIIADLSEMELCTMYEQYQSEIIEKAKKDFQELLFEKSEIFISNCRATHKDIQEALESDPRNIAMAHLGQEKNAILTRHISKAISPPNDNWGAQAVAYAHKSRRTRLSQEMPPNQMESAANLWQLTPDSDSLNIVLLGTDGLSGELANEITVHSSDEFTVDGCKYLLRLRSIDGDVTLPANSFKTSSFSPHGCIAVYSSMDSLHYIKSSLESTVASSCDSSNSDRMPPFYGLPVSILLAGYSSSKRQVHQLRDAGERLATRIGCPFIDVLSSEYACNRRFHESQIKKVMTSLVTGIEERAESNKTRYSQADNAQQSDADLRIVMCSRIDDFATAEMALAPLLNHNSFRDGGKPESEDEEEEETEDTIQVETYLGTQRRRIAVTMTSYQNAKTHLSKGSPVHGFILVYDTLLKSSFSIMKVFAKNHASSYPLLILCVSPDDKKPAAAFFLQDPAARQLVVEGNNLADELKAKFVSASARHRSQSEVYSTFFKDAWEHKAETESIHNLNRAVEEEYGSQEDSVEEQAPEPPVAPRTNLYRKKANSTEQLASKPLLDYGISDISVTPPSTLKLNFTDNYVSTRRDRGQSSPGSAWSVASADTPNTSPTAGLLDNEVVSAYSNFPGDANQTATTPVQSSHLYPGSASQPGKLNPDLINRVAAGIRKTSPSIGEMLSSFRNEHPYMAISDHSSKAGAVKVLPSTGDVPSKPGAKLEVKSDSKAPRSSVTNGYDNENHKRGLFGKRLHLKSVDMDATPTSARITPSRPTRHSTADLLSHSFSSKLDIDGRGMSKKTFTGSHEDLLHPSPSVPYALSGTGLGSGGDRIPPKDRFPLKKKKEEKKNKEKEQRLRFKEKQKNRNLPATPLATGNKHNISDYFNKDLDAVIQSLNHMVPLFVEKCVHYIESIGIHTEGLYRVPANQREREMIITKFDEDNNYDLKSSDATVHTVAGCLTWFFSHKNLPEPLISTHLHDELEEAAVAMPSSARNLAIRGIIRKLPFSNYATFKFISTHLKNVSDHSDENKMTVENLAICWCNTLFRPVMESNIALPKSFYKDVLTTCINQCGFMFYDQPEQLNV